MRVKIHIPDTLNEITLEQYQEYLKIQEQEKDQYVLGSKMIEIFCKVPFKNIFEYRVSHINRISKTLTDIFNQETKYLVRHFKIGNVQYGFIPELDKMSFGEYVDLDSYFKDWQDMHKAMSVLYRPVTQKYSDRYNIEKYKADDGEHMKQMPLDACFSSIVFFYNLGNDLSRTMLDYMRPEEREIFLQSQILDQNGAGISQFMHSLKEMLQSTKILLN
jgi:hypothetical protein